MFSQAANEVLKNAHLCDSIAPCGIVRQMVLIEEGFSCSIEVIHRGNTHSLRSHAAGEVPNL